MSELTRDVLQKLAEPFPASAISIKIQTKPKEDGGKALCVAYLDARDVMNRLDEVVGGEWSDDYRAGPAGGVHCSLTVCGVTRCDVGKDDNDTETEKTGYSDAFKRAAVKFGIGRFLYSLPKMWGVTRRVGEKTIILADGEEARLQDQIARALNGHKPATKEQAAVERQKELAPVPTPAPVSDPGKALAKNELMTEHGRLWHLASVKDGMLSKDTVVLWSVKANDTAETIQRKIGLLKQALGEA